MIKDFTKKLLSTIAKPLRKKHILITSSLQFFTRSKPIPTNHFDYIRLSALELAAQEINTRNLKGNVAELGVCTGGFAKFINTYFPNRLLYLFDTFKGFDKRDVTIEQQKDFSTGSQDFSNTSIESVLKIMPYREKCIPKKGYFPESAANVEDIFVFVSIDTDLIHQYMKV